jgi:hypothetical protein
MLGVRGRPGDHTRAQTLLRDAASTSARRGFDGLAEQVATLQATAKVAP